MKQKDILYSFEVFFDKLSALYKELYDSKPKVYDSEFLNHELILSLPDKNGMVEWLPISQKSALVGTKISGKLGFSLSEELLAYYTTYLFLEMDGTIDNLQLCFDPIISVEGLLDQIVRHLEIGRLEFPFSELFFLASVATTDIDGLLLLYDNITRSCFAFDPENENIKQLPGLMEIISQMEPTL